MQELTNGFGMAIIVGKVEKGKWHQHRTRQGRYYTTYCWGVKVCAIGRIAQELHQFNRLRLCCIQGELRKDKSGLVLFASRIVDIEDLFSLIPGQKIDIKEQKLCRKCLRLVDADKLNGQGWCEECISDLIEAN